MARDPEPVDGGSAGGADGGDSESSDELISSEEMTQVSRDDLLHQLFGFNPSDIASGNPEWGSSFRIEVPDEDEQNRD